MKRVLSLFLVFLIFSLALTINPVKASDWVNPTNFTDVSGDWLDESKAYDDVLTTYSYHATKGFYVWTGFLELLLEANITSDCLRVYFSWYGSSNVWVDLDVYLDGAWVGLHDALWTLWDQWVEKSYAEGQVSKMRIRMQSVDFVTDAFLRIKETDFWEVTEDVAPPTYSNVSHNTSIVDKPCEFSCKWADSESNLDWCGFMHNNTGTWSSNETLWDDAGVSTKWANKTLTLNGTAGQKVSVKWFCNDTEGNMGSVQYTITVGNYEDFTTYTEVDPNSHIGLAGANHVDHYALRNEDAYLYKDKGVDYFGNFEHLVDVRSDFLQSGCLGAVWALTNDVDDMQGLTVGSKTFVVVYFYRQDVNDYRMYLFEGYGGSTYQSSPFACALNTWYYLKIAKSGTSITCKIYSDVARTSLLNTLSLTLHADHKFRYIFGCNGWNTGHNLAANNDIENLVLQEAVAEHNFYGLVNSQISLTSQRSWSFNRVSSINEIFSIQTQKSMSFSLFAAISQAFSISSLFNYFQTRNFFGSITQLFSAASKRTWIFDVQGLIQQVFGIQSYTSLPTATLYLILGLISFALSCITMPLSIKKSKSAFIFILSVMGLVFAVIAIALSNFATAALAFVLAIPALALSLIKQEEQT